MAISPSGYVFNPQTGESFSLNPIAVEVVRMLQDGRSVEEVTEHVTSCYDVTRAAFRCDMDDFMGLLHQYGMLADE